MVLNKPGNSNTPQAADAAGSVGQCLGKKHFITACSSCEHEPRECA